MPGPAAALVLGGASWNRMLALDALPPPAPGTVLARASWETAGSTGIGKALALRALGHPAALHAVIGDDPAGARVRAFCAARGLDVLFDVTAAPTAQHVNLMAPDGARLSIFAEAGDPAPVVDLARLAPRIAAAGALFVGITPSSRPLLPLLHRAPGSVLVDLHGWNGRDPWHRAFLERADVVQLSDEALPEPGPVLAALAERARMVVLTRGARGALVLCGGAALEVPAAPARPVDSNGAGDVFSVALWSAGARGLALPEAARFAAGAAALAVESRELVPVGLDRAAAEARAAQIG